MKTRIPMATIYAQVAAGFRHAGDLTPTHCDVRCTVNEVLQHYDRDGYDVRWDYNQEAAWRAVRRMLCTDF